ncbi:MAG: hypothetical protein LUE22_00755 [Oscillospiraceae bacterium]|nr:hypothetical protein [Oscillospiraceae bacterium]
MKHNKTIGVSWGEFKTEDEITPWPGWRMDVLASEFSDEERAVVEDIIKSAADLIRSRLDEMNPEETA